MSVSEKEQEKIEKGFKLGGKKETSRKEEEKGKEKDLLESKEGEKTEGSKARGSEKKKKDDKGKEEKEREKEKKGKTWLNLFGKKKRAAPLRTVTAEEAVENEKALVEEAAKAPVCIFLFLVHPISDVLTAINFCGRSPNAYQTVDLNPSRDDFRRIQCRDERTRLQRGPSSN